MQGWFFRLNFQNGISRNTGKYELGWLLKQSQIQNKQICLQNNAVISSLISALFESI